MRRVAVVTDSAANLPPELVEKYQIAVIPLLVVFGREAFRDGVDITTREFYRRLRTEDQLPTTTTPSVGDFLSLYSKLSQKAESIVSIHLSRGLSATVETAEEAAQMFDEVPVHVIDSRTAVMAQGFIALEAARAAQGGGLEAVVARAEEMISRVDLIAMLDTLEYLYRGGRIGRAARLMGSVLNFKPLLFVKDGVADALERPRTRAKAMQRMLEIVAERVEGLPAHIAVMHADALEEAKRLHREVAARFHCVELYITEFTPVLGTHAGPGLVGLSFWAEDA
ncbi:MAG: DegV family protein [Chloroflexota bacterium]|nr:DegV family protein [Chloroflexota bacterium]